MKTWQLRDLEVVAKNSMQAYPSDALLVRIAREATDFFGAKYGDMILVPHTDSCLEDESAGPARALLKFGTIQLHWGSPTVGIQADRYDREDGGFCLRVGGQPATAILGYSFDVGWTEETPVAVFSAIFACALESIRTAKPIQ